jgi:hypothetical protein
MNDSDVIQYPMVKVSEKARNYKRFKSSADPDEPTVARTSSTTDCIRSLKVSE